MSVCKSWLNLHILRQISSDIAKTEFFSIIADECTDVTNNEQSVICIHWVDNTLTDHEDVIGLYNVGTIDSGALVTTMKDVLLRMSLKLTQFHGQWCGYKKATQLCTSNGEEGCADTLLWACFEFGCRRFHEAIKSMQRCIGC